MKINLGVNFSFLERITVTVTAPNEPVHYYGQLLASAFNSYSEAPGGALFLRQ